MSSRHAQRLVPRRKKPQGARVPGNCAIGVVGLGLIGGSLLKCLARRHGGQVLGFDASQALRRPVSRVALWCPSLDSLVAASDVVVLCVPVPAIVRLMPAIARASRARTRRRRLIVTDMGSMKRPVSQAASRWRGEFDYVGLHPLAGGELNGWRASDPDLYQGRTIVYSPSGPRQDRMARGVISLIGGLAVAMDPVTHDRMAAETIGLPHLLAFAAAWLRPPATVPHPLRGTSWAGLTRVSVSDPAFVAGLLHTNAPNQLRVVKRFRERLDALAALLGKPTPGPLTKALTRAGRGSP